VDGRLVYVLTRQPSIKSINFLDLGGRGETLEDDKLDGGTGRAGSRILLQHLSEIQGGRGSPFGAIHTSVRESQDSRYF